MAHALNVHTVLALTARQRSSLYECCEIQKNSVLTLSMADLLMLADSNTVETGCKHCEINPDIIPSNLALQDVEVLVIRFKTYSTSDQCWTFSSNKTTR